MSTAIFDFPDLSFPNIDIQYEWNGSQWLYFDQQRKKWLVLTPEEWVRQHAISYLINHLGYPQGLLKMEGGQKVHGLARRFDLLAFSRKGTPLLLLECKAPQVKITQSVFDQIGAYNLTQKAPYLVVTNGLQHFCCLVDFEQGAVTWLSELPTFPQEK